MQLASALLEEWMIEEHKEQILSTGHAHHRRLAYQRMIDSLDLTWKMSQWVNDPEFEGFYFMVMMITMIDLIITHYSSICLVLHDYPISISQSSISRP